MQRFYSVLSKGISIFLLVAGIIAAGIITPVAAGSAEQSLCQGSGGAWDGNTCTKGTRTVPGTIRAVADILVFLVSAISVIMVIVGGFRYALSGGDSSAASSAKNTILYAIIGLVVAVTSWAIVSFVVQNI